MTAKVQIKRSFAGYYRVLVAGKKIGAIIDANTGTWYFEGSYDLGMDRDFCGFGYREVRRTVIQHINAHLKNAESVWDLPRNRGMTYT